MVGRNRVRWVKETMDSEGTAWSDSCEWHPHATTLFALRTVCRAVEVTSVVWCQSQWALFLEWLAVQPFGCDRTMLLLV